MKTIRQIADEIGVSKQAVYKRYKGKLYTVCAPYAHTEQGVLYLSEQAETLIKQDFLRDGCPNGSHTDTHTERSIGAVPEQSQEAGVVAILQATIDTLQGQLSVKDKQIEELNARLAEVSSDWWWHSRLPRPPRHFMPEQFGSSLLMVKMIQINRGRRWSRKKAGFQKFLVADRKQKYIFFVSTSKKGGVIQ